MPVNGMMLVRRPPLFSLTSTFPVTRRPESGLFLADSNPLPNGLIFTPNDTFVILKVSVDCERFRSILGGKKFGLQVTPGMGGFGHSPQNPSGWQAPGSVNVAIEARRA